MFPRFFPPGYSQGREARNTCALHSHPAPRAFWGGGWETVHSPSLDFLKSFHARVLSRSFLRRRIGSGGRTSAQARLNVFRIPAEPMCFSSAVSVKVERRSARLTHMSEGVCAGCPCGWGGNGKEGWASTRQMGLEGLFLPRHLNSFPWDLLALERTCPGLQGAMDAADHFLP